MFKWFVFLLHYFLESEAEEFGNIAETVTVKTYYVNWQQMLPSYMTLLAWSFKGMCASF